VAETEIDGRFETLASGFAFCEAPRVADDGTAYFSDLTGGGYHACDPDGTIRTVLPDRLWIGGAVLDASGAIICGGKGGMIAVNPASGETQVLLERLNGEPIIAVNDIEADPRGGIFGGTIDFASIFAGETPRPGLFFRLDPSGDIAILRSDVVASNGIGFSPDGARLYHSESTVGVWRWQMEPDGLPHSPALFVELADCDGLAVDVEGGIWIACWQAAELRRYRPDGILDRRVALPFPFVTSLAFGGLYARAIHATTAGNGRDDGKGGLIRINSPVAGLPAHSSLIL